jgi:hypothetical protein
MKRTIVGFATTMLVSGGLGLAGLGLASGTAQAEPGFAPLYHWCPGDGWHPEWGNNWDPGTCHDDHHRDIDGDNHSRDAGFLPQDRRYVPRYHWCPGQFWRPEWGFNFDGNACHDDHHRDGDGDNHNNDFWP